MECLSYLCVVSLCMYVHDCMCMYMYMCILASKLLPLTLSHGTNDTPGHRRGLMRFEHLPWQQTTPISPRVMAGQVESLVELPLSCKTTFADFNSVYIDICHHKFQLRWREGGNNPGCPPLCMNNSYMYGWGGLTVLYSLLPHEQ